MNDGMNLIGLFEDTIRAMKKHNRAGEKYNHYAVPPDFPVQKKEHPIMLTAGGIPKAIYIIVKKRADIKLMAKKRGYAIRDESKEPETTWKIRIMNPADSKRTETH